MSAILCRLFGHRWQPYGGRISANGIETQWVEGFSCERCLALRGKDLQ